MKRTLNITEKFTSFNIDKINFLLQQNRDQRNLLCKYFYLFCFCDFFSYRKDHFEAVFSYFCSAFSIFCVLSFRQAPSSTAIYMLNNVQHLFNGRRTQMCEFICMRLIDIFALVSPLVDKLGHTKFLY